MTKAKIFTEEYCLSYKPNYEKVGRFVKTIKQFMTF